MSWGDWAAWGAVALSFVALGWQFKSAEDRRTWESEQESQRRVEARQLQDRQNTWQEGHDKDLRDWEAEQNRLRLEREEAWRREEIVRQEKWRQEDSIVASSPNLPRMEVTIKLSQGDHFTGPDDPWWLFIDAVNVGSVPIRLQTWGQLLLRDDTPFEHEKLKDYKNSHYFVRGRIDEEHAPGAWFGYGFKFEDLKDAVYVSPLQLPVEFRGYFEDQTGRIHTSEPFVFEKHYLTDSMPDS